jgi:hypothetical protein
LDEVDVSGRISNVHQRIETEHGVKQTISAHFDGEAIIPDEPVDLSAGQALRISIEIDTSDRNPLRDLMDLSVDVPDVPDDLSQQHDHYLYGSPKR